MAYPIDVRMVEPRSGGLGESLTEEHAPNLSFSSTGKGTSSIFSACQPNLERLSARIIQCRRCPRLVVWREAVGREKRAAFRDWDYWARPIPGFGDPRARIAIVGLAPAAHGGNRTGRVFTGDRSGDFLFAALHRAGLANQPTSVHRDDGLELSDAWITASVRCAPPDNKPTPEERDNCRPWLMAELALLPNLHVIVALGGFAWMNLLRTVGASIADRTGGWVGADLPIGPNRARKGDSGDPPLHVARPKAPLPKFRHGAETTCGSYALIASYHVSQQNTFTGRLTPRMLDVVLLRAIKLAGA